MSNPWIYDLDLTSVEFTASGLDAAYRVGLRIEKAIVAALETDPDVVEVTKKPYARAHGSRKNWHTFEKLSGE